MQRTYYWVLLLSFCLSAAVFAQVVEKEESDGDKPAEVAKNVRDLKAIEIIKKADAAIKKVTSVQYTSRREISGPLAKRLSPARGTVIYTMKSPENPPKYRTSVRMKPRNSEEEVRFTVGSDGDLFYTDRVVKLRFSELAGDGRIGERWGAFVFQGCPCARMAKYD